MKEVADSTTSFIADFKHGEYDGGYKYIFTMVTVYGQAIFNLRGGIRRNISSLVQSTKMHVMDLIWARNHPKYQKLEVYNHV